MVYPDKYKLDFAQVLSIITFIVFLFFAFFGTSPPFPDLKSDVNEIVTENIVNQLLYSLVFIFAILSLITKSRLILKFIISEKFLSAFIFFAFASIFWSDYSFISFKRLFQIITPILVFLAVLLNIRNDKLILASIRTILSIYLFATYIAVLVIPGALDPQFLTWRGLTYTKNNLGQISVVSFIISVVLVKYSSARMKKFDYLLLFLSIGMLFGARSGTSILTFISILFLMGIIQLSKIFSNIGVSRFVSFLTIAILISLIGTVLFFDSTIIADFTLSIGKDPSFTGRTDLWENILWEFQKHPFLGAGFQSFWIVENPDVLSLYKIFVWLPNQSHNGYLDMLNELGIIGFGIFVFMVIHYFSKILSDKKPNPWVFIIAAVLLINFQETTLFRPGNLSGLMFVFAYLFYFTRKIESPNFNLN